MPEQKKATITYDGKSYTNVREGLADILKPAQDGQDDSKQSKAPADVFYNPIQQFNRDLSVLAIRVFSEDYNLIRARKLAQRHKPRDGKAKRRRDTDSIAEELETKRPRLAEKDAANAEEPQAPTENGNASSKEETLAATDDDAPGAPANAPQGPKNDSKPPFRILDALSATGLRALRYSKEIENVTMVTANDMSASATEFIKLHVAHNNLAGRVFPLKGNAMCHMYYVGTEGSPLLPDGNRGKYQVVDLDPYGTAAPFLDAAVQSVIDGGMLCVTCTDSGVFASHGYPEKTFSQYGGLPGAGPHSHEAGLRLVLHMVAMTAARYGIAIEPVLSLSIDYYVRVFVRLRKIPSEVKLLAGKTMQVYSCDSGCGAWTLQSLARTHKQESRSGESFHKYSAGQAPTAGPHCEHCGFKTHLAGPMWGGPLHNPAFVQRMLDLLPSLDKAVYGTIPRIEGMLTTARDEMLLPDEAFEDGVPNAGDGHEAKFPIPRLSPQLVDPNPFYIVPSALAKVLHCVAPSYAMLRSALLGLGYRTARSHAKPGSLRTDAPWAVLWEVMREWVRQQSPIKEGSLRPGTPGLGVMRHDRSKRTAVKARSELRRIAESGDGVEQIKESLQAMLWRLEHPAEADARDESGQEKTEKGEVPGTVGSGRDLSNLRVVFNEELGKEPVAKKVVRYQTNPTANWGPQTRAKG